MKNINNLINNLMNVNLVIMTLSILTMAKSSNAPAFIYSA